MLYVFLNTSRHPAEKVVRALLDKKSWITKQTSKTKKYFKNCLLNLMFQLFLEKSVLKKQKEFAKYDSIIIKQWLRHTKMNKLKQCKQVVISMQKFIFVLGMQNKKLAFLQKQ